MVPFPRRQNDYIPDTGSGTAAQSPFVIAMNRAGIKSK